MSDDERNTDLTPAEMDQIIGGYFPNWIGSEILHRLLQAAADRALEKYLGTAEPDLVKINAYYENLKRTTALHAPRTPLYVEDLIEVLDQMDRLSNDSIIYLPRLSEALEKLKGKNHEPGK